MTSQTDEDQWVAIQHKTFVNWANEHLSLSNRSVQSLGTDLCDGVKLVALVEALQLQKVGKVFAQPAGRIQMMHNVGLALKAVREDHVRLVNIGPDDIVGGNLKLILGLLWHLILRYQISANKGRAPPKQLLLLWFQNAIPSIPIKNLTTCWQDGIALHALLEYCKPGLAPNWKSLRPEDRVENCRQAMRIAKEELGVPAVITPEDFASDSLDELSAMTYLSYFIRKDSPGYFSILNGVCRQLKMTTISNLTTDWNDGYQLCGLVHSLGGEIPGYPHNLDRQNHLDNCQKALDAAEKLGVNPVLTASELTEPTVDYLSLMVYLGRLLKITPRKAKGDKLRVDVDSGSGSNLLYFVDEAVSLTISHADVDVKEDLVRVLLQSSDNSITSPEFSWVEKVASCSFLPSQTGTYKIQIFYDDVEITGSPFQFKITHDYSKVTLKCSHEMAVIGQYVELKLTIPFQCNSPPVLTAIRSGDTHLKHRYDLPLENKDGHLYTATFKPPSVGPWTLEASVDGHRLAPVTVVAFDPSKANVTGPGSAVSGDRAICMVSTKGCGTNQVSLTLTDAKGHRVEPSVDKMSEDRSQVCFACNAEASFYLLAASIDGQGIPGSPLKVEVVDPSHITASGNGLNQASVGVEASFIVNAGKLEGNVTSTVDVEGYQLPVTRERLGEGCIYRFSYVPPRPGTFTIHVWWNDQPVADSPYKTGVTDKNRIVLQNDLKELQDENDHVALTFEQPTKVTFAIGQAGPGVMAAEMMTPDGKHLLEVDQTGNTATVSVVARLEGPHYIHVYWDQLPLPTNPILAYCSGPPKPVDSSKVILEGRCLTSARCLVPVDFIINGREAGPGVPTIQLQGLQTTIPTHLTTLKYDRYRCSYTCDSIGSFLLYVYWSGDLVPGCPYKVSVTPKGDPLKVKADTRGFQGAVSGQELRLTVDVSASGPGDITAECLTSSSEIACLVKEDHPSCYVISCFPLMSEKLWLSVKYDSEHIPGSPFQIRVSDPPDPSQVKVFGPGIEHGLVDRFESRFIVDTQGAGNGQLAVKIKGPRGGFKVDMRRESEEERIITCRYDPSESGQYEIQIRWSGVQVPNSPFYVRLVNSIEGLNSLLLQQGKDPYQPYHQWRAEV